MIDEVFPMIFRVEIPLPQNPLKAINSYVLNGNGRFLIIDTGMNRQECRAVMDSSLKELKVDLGRTDFFITHLHADHLGLVSELRAESSQIYFNRPDYNLIQNPSHWDEMASIARMHGFPAEEIEAALAKHPGRRFSARGPLPFTLLYEGDEVEIGKYRFKCVETPGHTRGHLCLYEPKERIFFSGDHILEDITPNISLWTEMDDPLQQYLESLDKIDAYDIGWVFPGHRQPFAHHRQRIAELKRHHEVRNQGIISILQKGKQNAYRVASQMTWDIDVRKWEDFPVSQKWFASGEALAHLQYLQGKGRVKKEQAEGKVLFSLPD
jgi:glyoxylase-like metal-dependent hydrolase (beta-lactamase superfamily II)